VLSLRENSVCVCISAADGRTDKQIDRPVASGDLARCGAKIGEIWRLWLCNRRSYKKLTMPRNQKPWSERHLSAVHPLSCKLVWVRCLFDPFYFNVFFGKGKWPLNGKFSKTPSDTFRGDVDSGFMAKFGQIGRREVAKMSSRFDDKKTLASCKSSEPPFCPNRPIAPKILWTLSPLDLCMRTEFGPDWLHFAQNIDFSDPRSEYKYKLKPVVQAFNLQRTTGSLCCCIETARCFVSVSS